MEYTAKETSKSMKNFFKKHGMESEIVREQRVRLLGGSGVEKDMHLLSREPSYHRNIGLVQYTDDCMNWSTNPDPTSMFVQYRGATIEVSVHLVDKTG